MAKIDIHCHTTNRLLAHILSPSATLATIEQEMQRHDVELTIVLATYFPHKGTGISNFRLYDWIRGNPKFLMFGSLDFERYFFQGLNELDEMAQRRALVGVKVYHGYQDIGLRQLFRVLDLCRAHRLPIMFHTGACVGLRPHKVADANLVELALFHYRDVPFILSHMMNPRLDWLFPLMEHYPNVYTDMSGFFNSRKPELQTAIQRVKAVYERFGATRILFGTDFPLQSHQHSIEIVEGALASATQLERDAVYSGNARSLLRAARGADQNESILYPDKTQGAANPDIGAAV